MGLSGTKVTSDCSVALVLSQMCILRMNAPYVNHCVQQRHGTTGIRDLEKFRSDLQPRDRS